MTEKRVAALIRRVGALGCLLMAVIVVTSAYLRLSSAGLGCDGWPECYGRAHAIGAALDPTGAALGTRVARIAHRGAAMTAGVIVALGLGLSLTRPARSLRNIACTFLLAALTVFLAVLGRSTAGTLSPAVTVANLVGGYGMLVLFWVLWSGNRPRVQPCDVAPRWLQCLCLATIAVIAMQAIAGGLVSAKFATTSCADLFACWPQSDSLGAFARGLDPGVALVLDGSGRVVPGSDAAAANALHRAGAILACTMMTASAVAYAVRARRRGLAALIFAGAALQCLLGWGLAPLGFPLVVALAHNALAVTLLLLLVTALQAPRLADGESSAAA